MPLYGILWLAQSEQHHSIRATRTHRAHGHTTNHMSAEALEVVKQRTMGEERTEGEMEGGGGGHPGYGIIFSDNHEAGHSISSAPQDTYGHRTNRESHAQH